jgi:hypothetical protein
LEKASTEADHVREQLRQALAQRDQAIEDQQRVQKTALDDLKEASAIIQQHGQVAEEAEKERTKLMEDVKNIRAENSRLVDVANNLIGWKGQVAGVKGCEAEGAKIQQMRDTISLDAFDNTLDQVLEAYVKNNNHSSLHSLNDMVDTMVQNTLEHALTQSDPHAAGQSVSTGERTRLFEDVPHEPILLALASTRITEDSRGLLLDAFIHHIVVRELHRLFFSGKAVSFMMPDTIILEKLFEIISTSGSLIGLCL